MSDSPVPSNVGLPSKGSDGIERASASPPGETATEARTDEIYRIAARIFQQKGYHATSINEIAEAVNLTKAGLYYYIKGKQDLLFQIMSFAMDLLESHVVLPARGVEQGLPRLQAILRAHADLISKDASALTILVNELEGLEGEAHLAIVARQKAYVNFVVETLQALKEEGKLQGIDPTVGAFGLLGMVLWMSRWYKQDGRLPREQVVEELTALATRAVSV